MYIEFLSQRSASGTNREVILVRMVLIDKKF